MESIYRLFSSLFEFTIFGAGLFFLIKALQFHRNFKAKNELQKLQARVSILRIALKSKVKKRANAFRMYFTKAIHEGGSVERDLSASVDLKFETSADFQKYFDLIRRVHAALADLPASFDNPLSGFIGPDEQHELVISKIIKEMKEISSKFNSKADIFNKANPKRKIGTLDPMVFSAMDDIQLLLQSETRNDQSVVEDDKFDAA